jgi:aspartyl aminopeptidase
VALLIDEKGIKLASDFCENYKTFLDNSKTERETSEQAVKLLKSKGFKEYIQGMVLTTGDKIYSINRGKSIVAAVIGAEPFENGLNICAAHIDSPRLDLKQRPLYEASELALLKTHYYGGIKKYQWTAVPLSLHGVVILDDGKKIEVRIGEEVGEPVFCVCDLLPHLAQEQMKRNTAESINGEELNILAGSMPFHLAKGTENDAVKLAIMNILNEKYGITEEDFVSAEIEAVPATKASDVGFDRSMVGGYGQDDRVCAYTALRALLDVKKPARTAVCLLCDKEEVGSDGNTGIKSAFFRTLMSSLAKDFGTNVKIVLANSKCISADVSAASDPTFPNVLDSNNAALLGHGIVIGKYFGSRGKVGTSDASAEFIGEIRTALNKEKVVWQTGELGKVDLGGGGTLAVYLANMGIEVLDAGVPVLSMHSPFEVASKLDIYMAYKAYLALYSLA